MTAILISKDILFYGDQTNPLSLVLEFHPRSDLAKINRTFRKNVNVIKMTELLKLQKYFINPTLEIKNPNIIEVVEKIQELLSEVFDISTKTFIRPEDHTRISEISTEIFTILKIELKRLRIFSRTMNHIKEEVGKNSFSHEKLVKMFEEINNKYLDLRKKNLLIALSIISIVVFSAIAIASLIATLVFLIKATIPCVQIDILKGRIFHDILDKTFIEYLKTTDIEEILSHFTNLEDKIFVKYLLEHLDDKNIIIELCARCWHMKYRELEEGFRHIGTSFYNVRDLVFNLYKSNSKVQDFIKLQNKIWGSFALKELLPLSLFFLISLPIIITSIVMLCLAIASRERKKRQNPNITRYINY